MGIGDIYANHEVIPAPSIKDFSGEKLSYHFYTLIPKHIS